MNIDLFVCMQSFIHVAESESYVQTAHKLHLSTSVLTRHIQALESYLKVQLIIRTTRSLKLTPAGLSYLHSARKIIQSIEEAKLIAKNEGHDEKTGIIKIAMPGILQGAAHIQMFSSFLEKYPDIKLQINTNRSPLQLLDKESDIVISEIQLNDHKFICENLYTITKRVFAAPKYINKYGTPTHINELSNHNCLIYGPASPTGEWEFAKKNRVKVSGNYHSLNGAGIIPAAIEGIGLLWVEEDLVRQEVLEGKLIPLEINPGPYKCSFNLYYLAIEYSGIVKLLIDEIIEYFNDYQKAQQ